MTMADAIDRLQAKDFTVQDLPGVGPVAEWHCGSYRVAVTLTSECGAWVATVERVVGDSVTFLESSPLGQPLAEAIQLAELWARCIASTTAYLAKYDRPQRARGAA
jgi:hypothetical protein